MFRAILLFLRASVSSVHRHSLFVTPPPPPRSGLDLGSCLLLLGWGARPKCLLECVFF